MNEEEPLPQEEQPPTRYPYLPSDEMGTSDSLRFQLDPDDLINKLKYIFLGYEQYTNPKTLKKEWKLNKEKIPLINRSGMDVLEPILRGYLDKLFPLSDLESEQIENITLGLEFDLRNLITMNFLMENKWEIKDLVTASMIKNIICNQVYATLRKAYMKGYQNFLRTVQRYHEIQTIQNRPEKMERAKGKISGIPVIGKLFG